MTTKFLDRPFDLKSVTDSGAFEGLASVYGNVDLGGDIVMPGAFREFALTQDGSIRILDAHNIRLPIGKGKLVDTSTGLAMKGQLVLAVPQARATHELMKAGIVDGLSIGYDILPGGSHVRQDGVRELRAIKLWEVSTTAFPMNQEARVSAVKTIADCADIRELEHLLREAPNFQLSSRKAKAAANALWQILMNEREAQDGDARDERAEKEAVIQIATTLDKFTHILKGIHK